MDDPRLILTLLLAGAALVAAMFAGMLIERHNVSRRDLATLDDLHRDILNKLNRACEAQTRWAKVDMAERVEAAFEARLAKSIALVEPFRKKIRAATGVFRPEEHQPHDSHDEGHGAHGGGAANATNGGVVVVVKPGHEGQGGGHGGAHDTEHRSDADRHEAVASALRDLRAHWRRHGLEALENARRELEEGGTQTEAPVERRRRSDAPLIKLA